jgi:hypothetical protein
MRTFLVLVAALGWPLAAFAQDAGGEVAPTVVSGVTVEAALPCGPADSWRPNALFDAPPDNVKTTRTGESPGTKAWLEKILAMFARPTMTDPPPIAPAGIKQLERVFPKFHQGAVCLGAIKSIKFLHMSAKGLDVYKIEYANGLVEGTITPLNARGEPGGVAFRPYTPQPVSMRFHTFLSSLERGRPDYTELAPDSAATLRAQWPTLENTVKGWGRLKMLSFARQEDDGSYAYRATYEHRQVLWSVFPPNADGKFGAVTHNEKAG